MVLPPFVLRLVEGYGETSVCTVMDIGDRVRGKGRQRQTGRQAGRQAGRHTGRQTDRQTDGGQEVELP